MLSQSHTISNSGLVKLPQFVAWHYDGGRKKPIDPKTLRGAKSNDPSTWADYETALEVAERGGYGLGFQVTKDDPYCFIDLDKCINEGEVEQWAMEIVESLDSYTEISPSGTGLRIWVIGEKPGPRKKNDSYETGGVEIYDCEQFSTITNRVFADKPIRERQEALEALYWQVFPQSTAPTTTPLKPISSGTLDDETLLGKARKNPEFVKLYDHGFWCGKKSQSEADIKLCGKLAFWTGCDEEQMVRLFKGSRLATTLDRKSDQDSYVELTVQTAIKNCNNVYDPNYRKVVEPRLKEVLADVERASIEHPWKGRSGPTDRDVLAGMINTGVVHGRLVDGGVRVAVSERDLALASGINRRETVRDALRRLEDRGWVRKLEDGRAKSAAVYLIKADSKPAHNNLCKYHGPLSSQTRRIRNPSQMVSTIGKRSGQILDYVDSRGWVTLESIAQHFGVRKNNLKTRNINTLLELGLLEEGEDGYSTPDDIEARLLQELEDSGTIKAEELQRQRIAIEREAYANRGAIPPPCQSKVEESQGVEDMQETKATVTPINAVNDARGYEVYSWVFDLIYGLDFVPVPIIMKACADEGITSTELQYAFDHLPIEEEFGEDDMRLWRLQEEEMDIAA